MMMRPNGGFGHRWSHGYSKAWCKHDDWYFPPPHIPCHYNNNVRGSQMFFFLVLSLQGEQNHGYCWGLESVSHPDLYPGHSWQSLYTLKVFSFLFSLGGAITAKVDFGWWCEVQWLMGTDGSSPALPSAWHLTHRQKKHDSICTLDLQLPELNNISGQFSFRFSWCKVKQCLF